MLVSIARASMMRLAGIFASAPTLIATAGCYHASTVSPTPSRVEQTITRLPNDERVVRRHPGVTVVNTRFGGFSIHILSGLTLNGEPLYIIDGNPMMVDPNRGIDWVKLEDIVEIKVLKDPAETTVYGTRGANGVIILTTRQAAFRNHSPR